VTPTQAAELRALAGPVVGRNLIGEVTEAFHRFLLDGWDMSDTPPRVEEDLEFVPKDREEILYVYMYKVAHNNALMNQKRLRVAPVFMKDDPEKGGEVYYHRPPVYVDLFYLVAVHSKFRSDAERMLGWTLLRLNEATHLIYRPRRFVLPDGRIVDSLGRTWDPGNFQGFPTTEEDPDDGLHLEKISLALVDDMTINDAIQFFQLHDAPYRPYLTYRARIGLDGPLYKSSGGTTIKMPKMTQAPRPPQPDVNGASLNGRVRPAAIASHPRMAPGPQPFKVKKPESETDE
jgi:hypothetical protein